MELVTVAVLALRPRSSPPRLEYIAPRSDAPTQLDSAQIVRVLKAEGRRDA